MVGNFGSTRIDACYPVLSRAEAASTGLIARDRYRTYKILGAVIGTLQGENVATPPGQAGRDRQLIFDQASRGGVAVQGKAPPRDCRSGANPIIGNWDR
jgi:hypothetical protein